jgi:23S rRNA pseudouridine1911/1915/1917 synthase
MIEILYKDKYILVCHKPAGLLCEGEGKDSLPALLSDQLKDVGERAELFTVHRLDRETEGIVVFARSSVAAAKLSEQITDGLWRKIYLAYLWGVPEVESGRLCDLLYYDRRLSKSFVVDRERKGVKSAELSYETVARSADGKRTLVRVELGTGRTHQIRVQFASRGTPLCGDRRYGAPKDSGSAIALAAVSLDVIHPKTNEPMHFEIEPMNLEEYKD